LLDQLHRNEKSAGGGLLVAAKGVKLMVAEFDTEYAAREIDDGGVAHCLIVSYFNRLSSPQKSNSCRDKDEVGEPRKEYYE
jgi:hypothetical protein